MYLPCEHRFLSGTALSICKVVRVAFQSRKQTNYVTDKPRERLKRC